MRKKMSEKHKLMAYVLSTDEDLNRNKNITQREIASLFDVSQPTVAQSIKETKLRVQIHNLEQELAEAKRELIQTERTDLLELPENINQQYKRKP